MVNTASKKKKTSKSKTSRTTINKQVTANKWLVIGIIAILAIGGVYFVRASSASTNIVYKADRISGSNDLKKIDGRSYRVANSSSFYTASLVNVFPSSTKSICAHVRWLESANVRIMVLMGPHGTFGPSAQKSANTTGNVCVTLPYKPSGQVHVEVQSSNRKSFGVDTIYGVN